jgi:rhomboid protease GluP
METPPSGQYPQASQPGPVRVATPRTKPYLTYIILGVTVAIYLLGLAATSIFKEDPFKILGIKDSNAIRYYGQLWRLITPVFLHASLLHITFNMYALMIYGQDVELRFGHVRFLLLYFLSAFAGNVMSFLLTPGRSLGASTAIFGLLAAETVFFIQNRRLFGARGTSVLTNLFLIAAVNLFIGFSTTGVDNWGHIGGLLGGLIFTWFGGPRYKVEGIYPLQHLVDERQGHGALSGTAAVLLFFIPLTALGWFWIVR